MHYLRENWLPLIVIAFGFSASLAIAFAPLNFILSNTLPDDAFYYFQLARNIAHGFGPTFDGVNPTNGYHPLWLLMLVPVYHYFSSGAVMDIAPIRVALVVSALCNGLVGLVLLAVLRRYTSSAWILALSLGVWFLNPFNLYTMENGLETPLSILFITLFILAALRVKERSSSARLIALGVIGGLMMLARLDNVCYFLMILAWLLYEWGWRRGFRKCLWVGVPATIVVAPWLTYNYLTFGMVFTASSAATTLVEHQLIVQDHGPSILQKIKAAIFVSDYTMRQIALQTGAPSVFFALLGLSAAWFMYGTHRIRQTVTHIPVEWFLFAGFVLNFIANATIRWSPREWYFIPLHLFMVIWIAWLLTWLRAEGKLRFGVVAVVALLTCALFYVSWSKNLRDGYNTSQQIFETTMWMNSNLPQGALVGAFNAGIEGYFSTHRLINLDGLVNNRAFEALEQRRIWGYIQSEHIQYLADNANRVAYRMKGFLGIPDLLDHLDPIYTSDIGASVYKIK